jgi:NADPH:quinone reductase-like Zn-dependent oxidoreductase
MRNPKGGFYAEYTAVPAEHAWPIPSTLTTAQAGAMSIDAGTALRGLRDILGLQPGEALLIFGASGGIGHLAVQLAKRLGVCVLAVASGDDGVQLGWSHCVGTTPASHDENRSKRCLRLGQTGPTERRT